MNTINFLEKPNFPLSSDVLNFMQQSYLMMQKFAVFGGKRYILTGCEEVGNTIKEGFIVVDGEVMPFAEGTRQSTIIVISETRAITAFGENFNVYNSKYAHFGTGSPQYAWSDFVRIPNIQELLTNYSFKVGELRNMLKGVSLVNSSWYEWLPCDGRVFDPLQYPDLAELLQDTGTFEVVKQESGYNGLKLFGSKLALYGNGIWLSSDGINYQSVNWLTEIAFDKKITEMVDNGDGYIGIGNENIVAVVRANYDAGYTQVGYHPYGNLTGLVGEQNNWSFYKNGSTKVYFTEGLETSPVEVDFAIAGDKIIYSQYYSGKFTFITEKGKEIVGTGKTNMTISSETIIPPDKLLTGGGERDLASVNKQWELNGKIVVYGNGIIATKSGDFWTYRTVSGEPMSAYYSNGKYFVFGVNSMYISSNAIDWSLASGINLSSSIVTCMIFFSGKYYLSGGFVEMGTSKTRVYFSQNGIDWSIVNEIESYPTSYAAFMKIANNNLFVGSVFLEEYENPESPSGAGYSQRGTILQTADGVNWLYELLPTPLAAQNYDSYPIALEYINEKYVVASPSLVYAKSSNDFKIPNIVNSKFDTFIRVK